MFDVSPGAARRLAFLAAFANALAGGLTLFVLRRGLPPQGLVTRSTFISSHRVLWQLGWLAWNAAAITLLGLFLALAARWWKRAPVSCGLAIVVATAGLGADISAEALLAGFTGSTLSHLSLVQSEGLLLTGYVANGLYTVAGILLTAAGRKDLPVGLLALAGLVWATGVWLSAATLLGSTTGETVSTGILIASFVVWAALLGRWFGSLAS
ncbi:MAG: hypothetical protein M3P43_02415 [Actinomycetota bacterium]|nr:hypothetical protein [Actinomycetota bacterium]